MSSANLLIEVDEEEGQTRPSSKDLPDASNPTANPPVESDPESPTEGTQGDPPSSSTSSCEEIFEEEPSAKTQRNDEVTRPERRISFANHSGKIEKSSEALRRRGTCSTEPEGEEKFEDDCSATDQRNDDDEATGRANWSSNIPRRPCGRPVLERSKSSALLMSSMVSMAATLTEEEGVVMEIPYDVYANEPDTGFRSGKKNNCCTEPGGRLEQMHKTADWWSLWIGLFSFAFAMVLVFIVQYDHGSYRVKYVIPQPMRWETNPFDAWDLYGVLGTILLLAFLCSLYLLAIKCCGKLEASHVISHAKGFAEMGVIATLAFWLGRNKWCYLNGLGYAVFSILFGIIITNSPLASKDRLSSLKLASKEGEFFIKCSLALLAVEFSILGEVGLPAIVVSWVGSPLALLLGYFLAKRLFKMETTLALLIAVGSTWCGASAISAVGSVIGSSSADISLCISVVAFFTVIFTFVQPYIAIGVGMDWHVAGAWIGGSVDQTGNVIASAAIISEEATEVAAVVKIVLNSGLGILATVIALWWQTRLGGQDGNGKSGKKSFSWLFLWDKFPKFVLGYLLCSGVLSIVLPRIQGRAEADAMQRAIISMNTWWFAIGFVGIGMGTRIKDLWHGAKKSGVIQGYLIANLLDIGIALGLSYAMF